MGGSKKICVPIISSSSEDKDGDGDGDGDGDEGGDGVDAIVVGTDSFVYCSLFPPLVVRGTILAHWPTYYCPSVVYVPVPPYSASIRSAFSCCIARKHHGREFSFNSLIKIIVMIMNRTRTRARGHQQDPCSRKQES